MDTIPGPKQALSTQACLPLSWVCPLWGWRRKSLGGTHLRRALTPGRSLCSLPRLLSKQLGGGGQKAAGQTEWRVGIATGSRRGPRFLGWDREVQWVLGRARLLNSAFANHFLSLFSGAQPPDLQK